MKTYGWFKDKQKELAQQFIKFGPKPNAENMSEALKIAAKLELINEILEEKFIKRWE